MFANAHCYLLNDDTLFYEQFEVLCIVANSFFVQAGLLGHIFRTMDLQQLKLLSRWRFVNFLLIMDLLCIVMRIPQMKDPLSLWLVPSVF